MRRMKEELMDDIERIEERLFASHSELPALVTKDIEIATISGYMLLDTGFQKAQDIVRLCYDVTIRILCMVGVPKVHYSYSR